MNKKRPIHPHFQEVLDLKSKDVIDLYKEARAIIFEIFPEANELIYHTHALTSVFSISEKLSDAFCMLPIYTNHVNLGFNKGALLEDPKKLLKGTGKYIRHIPIVVNNDFKNPDAKALILAAINLAKEDMDKPSKVTGNTISKIKK